jgi:hypothetical protein
MITHSYDLIIKFIISQLNKYWSMVFDLCDKVYFIFFSLSKIGQACWSASESTAVHLQKLHVNLFASGGSEGPKVRPILSLVFHNLLLPTGQ